MEIALDSALGELRALCARGFGPCGAQTLLFRPPDAPLITGSGHSVLSAWKETLNSPEDEDDLQVSKRGITRIVLSAVEGLNREIGDGTSELVLLLHAASKIVSRELAATDSTRKSASYRQLSRALGELKWTLKEEMDGNRNRFQLAMSIPVEVERISGTPVNDDTNYHGQRLQPTDQFRSQLANVLASSLSGMVGHKVALFLSNLVIQWMFSCHYDDCLPLTSDILYKYVQLYLKRASDAVMWMMSSSVRSSCVVPPGDFILRQSVVGAQQQLQFNDAILQCTGRVRFLCITCPLSLHAGSNLVTVTPSAASGTDFDAWTSVKDSTKEFIARFIKTLRCVHQVQLIICTEPIQDDVVAMFTRSNIACVQYAEPEEVVALGIASGTVAIATLFDKIAPETHVGSCRAGVGVLRLQHRLCLRLRGIGSQIDIKKGIEPACEVGVPQLLLHAPSKGIYKQYFECIVKALRVLRSLFKPNDSGKATSVLVCKGAGATEFAVARILKGKESAGEMPDVGSLSLNQHWDDRLHFKRMARRIVADALLEVVVQLQTNIRLGTGNEVDAERAGRRVVLGALATQIAEANSTGVASSIDAFPLYLLDQKHRIETSAGVIMCPQLIQADPGDWGLVHPWARIDVLLFQMLSILEQLFRIDSVVRIKRTKVTHEDE